MIGVKLFSPLLYLLLLVCLGKLILSILDSMEKRRAIQAGQTYNRSFNATGGTCNNVSYKCSLSWFFIGFVWFQHFLPCETTYCVKSLNQCFDFGWKFVQSAAISYRHDQFVFEKTINGESGLLGRWWQLSFFLIFGIFVRHNVAHVICHI